MAFLGVYLSCLRTSHVDETSRFQVHGIKHFPDRATAVDKLFEIAPEVVRDVYGPDVYGGHVRRWDTGCTATNTETTGNVINSTPIISPGFPKLVLANQDPLNEEHPNQVGTYVVEHVGDEVSVWYMGEKTEVGYWSTTVTPQPYLMGTISVVFPVNSSVNNFHSDKEKCVSLQLQLDSSEAQHARLKEELINTDHIINIARRTSITRAYECKRTFDELTKVICELDNSQETIMQLQRENLELLKKINRCGCLENYSSGIQQHRTPQTPRRVHTTQYVDIDSCLTLIPGFDRGVLKSREERDALLKEFRDNSPSRKFAKLGRSGTSSSTASESGSYEELSGDDSSADDSTTDDSSADDSTTDDSSSDDSSTNGEVTRG